MDWLFRSRDSWGLTKVQLDHRIKVVRAAKDAGKAAVECHNEKCRRTTAYCYNSFSHRGGIKYLYGCMRCNFGWSELEVEEEDYDFLPR